MNETNKNYLSILADYLQNTKELPELKSRRDVVDVSKLSELTSLPLKFLKSKTAKKLIKSHLNKTTVLPVLNDISRHTIAKNLLLYIYKISENNSNQHAILTVYRSILNALEKTEYDLIDEFFNLESIIYTQKINDIFNLKKENTKLKYIQLAHKIKEHYNSCVLSNNLPDDFCEALKEVHKRSGLSIRQVERIANIKKDYAKNIIRGVNTPKNKEIIIKLEKAYKLPPHTLLNKVHKFIETNNLNKGDFPKKFISHYNKIKPYLSDLSFDFKVASENKKEEVCQWIMENIVVCNNSYSKKCAKNLEKKFRYTNLDESLTLKDELKNLIDFKESVLSDIDYQKNDSWNEHSSKKNKNSILYFFGFVDKHAVNEDISRKNYSITLLLNKKLVHQYIQFKIQRRGKFSSDDIQFLILVCSLLRDKYGYIYQTKYYENEEIIANLIKNKSLPPANNTTIDKNYWQYLCLDTHKYYYELKKQIETTYKKTQIDRDGNIAKSRDPFAPISPILDSNEPIKCYLNLLCKAKEKFIASSTNPLAYISFMNGYISLMIILQTGLRAKNMRSLVISNSNDNTGEHIFKEHDKFYLDVPAYRVKNKQRTFTEIINTNNLYADIEKYIQIKRNIFTNSNENFIVTTQNKTYQGSSFSNMIRNFTRMYICYHKYRIDPGMVNLQPHGPHALRDIIATHVIKKTGSFALAAIAIRDTEQTVRKHYARFLPEDKSSLFREITSDIF